MGLGDGLTWFIRAVISLGISIWHTTGSYAGDGTANRPIAHGLGRTPSIIIILSDNPYLFFISSAMPSLGIANVAGIIAYSVNPPNNTNFFVGNPISYPNTANDVGVTYAWIAFA